MVAPVALRQRGQFTQLLTSILHHARQNHDWQEPDVRNLRLWRSFILAIIIRRSTCLLHLAQVLRSTRRAQTVKSLALGVGYFLTKSQCAIATLIPCVLDAVLASLRPDDLVGYRGHVLLVLDTHRRSQTQPWLWCTAARYAYIGRVRKSTQCAWMCVWQL